MGQNKKIAIVGAGLIGGNWVLHFLRLGHEVTAFDPADGAEKRLRAQLRDGWPVAEKLGVVEGVGADSLKFADKLEDAVSGCDVVLECAPERLEIKQDLFAEMDRLAAPDVLLFSCTSSFMISDIRIRAKNPERCLLGHPFNPPHLLPLVEVAGGARDSAHVQRAMDFWEAVEKVPVHLKKEMPGHLVNRLTAALFREAVHLVAEGVADVEDIDKAIVNGPGPRLALAGPFLNYHLGGGPGGIEHYFEHLGPSQVARWKSLGDPELADEVVRAIIDGVKREAGDRSYETLSAERDDGLIKLFGMKKG